MNELDRLFRPRSVAVVGASRRTDSIGWHVLDKILSVGFNGKVFAVNPRADHVHSLKSWPSVSALPDPIDLAVILVPRDAVLGAVRECADCGVGALVVISAGFRETGPAGAALEAEILEVVRESGMRMVGPNCMGIINADPEVRLDATFAPLPAKFGKVAFASQSGALGVAILNAAAELGIGFTQFVSMGNKADVSASDLLERWETDPATEVIGMYLESFGNPRRFAEIVRRVGREKPVIMVKSGRTRAGALAASSHTGALAGADRLLSALLEQVGVLRVDTLDEMFDVVTAFSRCPPLPTGSGGRVAIVSNAGGPGIMATDALVNHGLELTTLTTETRQRLASFLPPEASLVNPVDMIASADTDAYVRTLEAVLADPNVDATILINVTPILFNPIEIVRAVTPIIQAAAKPTLAVMMASDDFYADVQAIPDHPPIYRFTESAARALAHVVRHSRWRSLREGPATPAAVDEESTRRLLDAAPGSWLPLPHVFEVLAANGFPVAPFGSPTGRVEALAMAAELGFPVVLKAWGDELVHKSDQKAVALNLDDEEAVGGAWDDMTARLGEIIGGFVVQKQLPPAREMILGLTCDPQIGPALMVGLGGRYVEVWDDVRFAIPPLTNKEAEALVRQLQGYPILAGIRGDDPVDLDGLNRLILRLSDFAVRYESIAEFEINPLLLGSDAGSHLVVDARIRLGGPAPV